MSAVEAVRCPTCRDIHQSDADATDYTCSLCGSEWMWAICEICDRLELALAGQESWRCDTCARYTRSWWRTPEADSEAIKIREKRAANRAALLEARLAGPRRRRRLMLVTGGAVAVCAALVAVVVLSIDRSGTAGEHTRVACTRFEAFRSELSNGNVQGEGLAAELAAIREHAQRGYEPVAFAASRLTAPRDPNSADFLVAQTKFASACATAAP